MKVEFRDAIYTHNWEWLAEKNLKKCLVPTERLNLVSKEDKLSVTRQCELLKFYRTSVCYAPVEPDRNFENIVKNRLNYWHTKIPYTGVRKLRNKLQNESYYSRTQANQTIHGCVGYLHKRDLMC